MCGFAGFLEGASSTLPDEMTARLRQMRDCLVHRGPDDSGEWVDADNGIALGFRRLAILDLSEHGHQPMPSMTGRYVIVFNGEIYNFRQLRAQLEEKGPVLWRGHSDTEVLLEAIAQWGFEEAIRRCNGMFAIALWDREQHTLSLARDRAGEKPLYYGWLGDTFVFGSELKALVRHPRWTGEIDRGSLARYFRLRYVPGPVSVYRGVNKLEAGHFLIIKSPRTTTDRVMLSRPYWDARSVAEKAFTTPFLGSETTAVDHLSGLLGDAVALRMVSDVPLGAFLSGGIDSSLIASLMCERSKGVVRTFSIGFAESGFDEAPAARAVAEHLGTEHTELYVTGRDAIDLIPSLPRIYDEPFADSSQLPTALLSRMTRAYVTVALSGDAGDELFAGYNRHVWVNRLSAITKRTPRVLRTSAAAALQALSPGAWNSIADGVSRVRQRGIGISHFGDSVHKLAGVLDASSSAQLYERLVTDWDSDASLVLRSTASERAIALPDVPRGADEVQAFMYLDFLTYLKDDILVKVDRASMSASLESRVPFLDPAVIEFAWSLPTSLNVREGRGKHILRSTLARYVPRALTDRPKQGFAVPIAEWLRGPLRDWAESLLDPRKMDEEGYLNPSLVQQVWGDHLRGKNQHHRLWSILMFQAWLRTSP